MGDWSSQTVSHLYEKEVMAKVHARCLARDERM